MIRVALLGTGTMGRAHADAYASIPGATVAAVVGRDHAAAEQLAAPLGATVYDDMDAMLAAEEIDAIDCCLPTPLHRPVVEASVARGRHVICEKPLALTAADARAMIAACNGAGVHLLMGQVLRFVPEYRRLAIAVESGDIGTPVTCTLLRQSFYPTGRDSWLRDQTRSGGIFVDFMIHDFDWALCQFGPARRVYAQLVQRGGERPFAQGMATVRHRSGVLSQITGTWGFPGAFTTAVEIAGTGGLLRYHSDDAQAVLLLTPPATVSQQESVALPDLSAGENPFHTELAHFIAVLEGHAEPLVRPDESLAALELALAARRAAETGRAQALGAQEVA